MGRKASTTIPLMNVVEGDFAHPIELPQPDWQFDVGEGDWGEKVAEIAAEQWEIVTSQMRASGILAPENASHIELYCVNYARWKMAEAMIAKHGPLTMSVIRKGLVKSPYLTIANKAAELMVKIGSDLGLTPAMRGRVTQAKRAEKTARASDRYLELGKAQRNAPRSPIGSEDGQRG